MSIFVMSSNSKTAEAFDKNILSFREIFRNCCRVFIKIKYLKYFIKQDSLLLRLHNWINKIEFHILSSILLNLILRVRNV